MNLGIRRRSRRLRRMWIAGREHVSENAGFGYDANVKFSLMYGRHDVIHMLCPQKREGSNAPILHRDQ